MKYKALQFFIFGVFCCLFSACTEDIQTDFILNGQDLNESLTEPEQPYDSTVVITINAGDTIIITDTSTPVKSIKSRLWDIDGDGIWDDSFNDSDHFATAYENEGLYKITFCTNGEKSCITKWVNVEGIAMPLELDESLPVLTFIKPDVYSSVSDEKYLEIEVQTENIFSKDELTLMVRDKEARFVFDETTGILSAKKIRLSKGENIIEVQANIGDGWESTSVIVEYGKGGSGRKKDPVPISDPDPDPIPDPVVPPVVSPVVSDKPLPIINIKDRNLKTQSQQATVRYAIDYFKKREMEILLNGVPQKDYKKVGREWSVNLSLDEGINRLIITASNANGSATAETVVTYTKAEEKPLERERPLANACKVGIPSSQYAKFSQDCIALYTKDKYEVILLPNRKVELQSFYVYSNDCGGLEITLEGDGDKQSFKASLNAGKSQILMNVIDTELTAQKSYKLTLRPLGNYKGCNASAPARLEKVTDCNVSQVNCNALKLNQNNNPVLYDLKIKY